MGKRKGKDEKYDVEEMRFSVIGIERWRSRTTLSF
jgi:hypothetical protein